MEQKQPFDFLKRSLIEAPLVVCPDCRQLFVLQTGASDEGLEVALMQEQNGIGHVVTYVSPSFNILDEYLQYQKCYTIRFKMKRTPTI